MQREDAWDLSDADAAAWREMMAELAAGDTDAGGTGSFLLVANDGDALVRLSLLDRAGMPLGVSRIVGHGALPLAAGDVAEALVRRGWVEPVGGAGGFGITDEGRSA